MVNKATFGLALLSALAFGLVGCSDDSGTAGTGGVGGSGGTGGAAETANITAVHLAPAVPSAESTEVSIFLDGEEAGVTLSYGESTGRIELPAGTYDIGVGLPGGDEPLLQLDGVELVDGDDLTVVAYATNGEIPFNVFVFSNSTEDLASGSGRVFVGHGANSAVVDPVNVVLTDADVTECTDLIPGFVFGTTAPETGVLDLEVSEVTVGFTLEDTCPPLAAGPIAVPVTPDVVSILVAVDEDTGEDLDLELWAIVDASDEPIPLVSE